MQARGALMATQQTTRMPDEIVYPTSDGQPMAEADTHWLATAELAFSLKHRYRDEGRVYVASANFVYYEQGNPRAVFSPDVYVVFGVPKRLRRSYKVWEEGGRCPDVVFEVSSRDTWLEDTGNEMAVCARLGVREYFLFDPERDYLDPPLQGYRLDGRHYTPLAPRADGSLTSEVLGLILAAGDGLLTLTDAKSGEPLLGPCKAQDALADAEVARLRAELERMTSRDLV